MALPGCGGRGDSRGAGPGLGGLGAAVALSMQPGTCDELCRERPGEGRGCVCDCECVCVCVCVCVRERERERQRERDIYRSRVKLDLPAVDPEERKKIEVLFLNRFFPLFFFFFFFYSSPLPLRGLAIKGRGGQLRLRGRKCRNHRSRTRQRAPTDPPGTDRAAGASPAVSPRPRGDPTRAMRALSLGLVALTCATTALCAAGAQRRALEGGGRRRYHRVQHGHCSYTFVLPEAEPLPCPAAPGPVPGPANALLQRDSPAGTAGAAQRLRHLERILENSTQWLLKLESYIQSSVKPEVAELQQAAVQNQTAAMLEMGSSLLNRSAEQSRKLTDVEAQVLNQTWRIEMQLQENSLSTTKLEKQLLLQTNEIHKLQNRNNILEVRVLEMETKQQAELAGAHLEKEKLQRLLSRQSGTIEEMERTLLAASANTSLLQRQQLQLLQSVQSLVRLVSQGRAMSPGQEQQFQDCAEVRRAGIHASGIYTLHIANLSEPKKAFCDMETDRGGWTIIQLRANGSLSFQRSWREYKQGFGDASGEYWLGNEAVHLLTSRAPYALRVELQDWEGGQVYAQYGKFQLGSERQFYRLSLQDYSGTAGQQSGLALQGTHFSTRDSDNDNCLCKCAQMLSGGWWFDACGLSNLNGIYYPARNNIRKLNGIRWHHFQGPSYSLKGTRMMIRPSSF